MYQGTTPAVTMLVKDFDMTGSKVFVSFKNKNGILTKKGSRVVVTYDDNTKRSTVVCFLTQEETLNMKPGATIVQMRFIFPSGQAWSTNKQPLQTEDVIYKEIIQYDGGDE